MGLLTPGISPLTCCCCCGGSGCGWVESWANLDAWTVGSGTPVVSGGQLVINPGDSPGFAEVHRDITGAYSVTSALVPPPGDGDSVLLLLTTPALGPAAPLTIGVATNMGTPGWVVVDPLGNSTPVTPSGTGAQIVVVEWNAAGNWTVTIGNAPAVTGAGLTGAAAPTELMLFLVDDSGSGSPAVAETTVECTPFDCGWVELWANLDAWVTAGDPVAASGTFTAINATFGIGSRVLNGGFSISTVLTPGAEDTTVALLPSDPVSGFSAPIIVGQQWVTGDSIWVVQGTLMGGGPAYVTPTNPEDPQLVTIQWNMAGQWSVTIGDAAPVTGAGLGSLAPMPTQALVFARASALEGGLPSRVGAVTVDCTELPPLSFGDVVLGLNPLFYFPLDQTGAENPVDSVGAVTTSLNAPYTWGVAGPVDGLTALDLSGGSFSGNPRIPLTGSQTRLAFVKTTSTASVPAYDGDAALTVFGDTDAETWDSFGVSDGFATYTRFNGSAWQTCQLAGTPVNDGAWHLILMTYDSGTLAMSVYADGSNSGSSMLAHQAKGGIVQYGRGYDPADNFDGSLAHLAVWDRVLTSGEINSLLAYA